MKKEILDRKVYLIHIQTKGKEQIFIMSFNGKKELKNYLEVNYPRNKLSVFRINELIINRKRDLK